jgi:hypothetical protein
MAMALKEGCARKSTLKTRQLLFIIGFSLAWSIPGHRPVAAASWGHPSYELAQQAPPPAQPAPSTPASQPAAINQARLSALQNRIKDSVDEVTELRRTNQSFSIAFIVAGITLTLMATSLGAVESQNADVKKWTKFAIVGLGACAVAAQSLNAAFPVTRKAAEFADIYWNLKSLQNEVDSVTTDSELKQISTQYSELLKRAGKAESSLDQPKKN